MMLFSGLAAKVHCQSGFAPRTAGFHQTPPQTSHSKRHPEVTESVRDITSAAAHCQSQGKAWEMGGHSGCPTECCNFSESRKAAWRRRSAPTLVECGQQASLAGGSWLIIGINVTVCNSNLIKISWLGVITCLSTHDCIWPDRTNKELEWAYFAWFIHPSIHPFIPC